jgi:hypothetical protein
MRIFGLSEARRHSGLEIWENRFFSFPGLRGILGPKRVKMRKIAISRAKWRVVGPVKAYNMRIHKAHRR